MAQKSKGLKRAKLLIILLAAAIIMCALFFLANKYLFKVRNWTINISGGGGYSHEDIIRASGIEEGAQLFGFDRAAAVNNIKRELSYVAGVTMIRFPPSTVRIDVQTDEAVFGFMLGGDYYIVTENFRVAEKIRMYAMPLEYVKPPGVINIVTYDITRCFVGERIEFGDEDILYFLKELLRLVRGHEAAGMISSVDIRDKFDVVMTYGDSYTVRFGVFENVYSKALNSFYIIEWLYERGSTAGIIDVSDERTALFRPE